MRIAVLGSGVIGLTSAYTLAREGHSVEMFSEVPPAESTSSVAGALWYPSKLEPEEKVRSWALTSLQEFKNLATNSETGVRILPIRRWFHRRMGSPWWAKQVEDFKLLYSEDCPGARCGYLFQGPVIDMPRYLRWLEKSVKELGVVFYFRKILSLDELSASYDACINCTGMGAKNLCEDTELIPVRGITLIGRGVKPPTEAFMDWDNPSGISYIVPRENEVVLGGSEEREPYQSATEVAEEIRIRCFAKEPKFRSFSSIETRIGFRPFRSSIRIEWDTQYPKWLHHYGHGGSGVTLSWGSASEVNQFIDYAGSSKRA